MTLLKEFFTSLVPNPYAFGGNPLIHVEVGEPAYFFTLSMLQKDNE